MSTGDLIKAIYTHLQKKKQDTITEILKGLELTHLAERQNISTRDVDEIRRLNNMLLKDLKKIAKLRNILNYSTLSREDLIYTLLRSEKAPNENNYMKYIQNNEIEKIKDKIKDKIKIIKIELLKLSKIKTGKDRDNIKKELKDMTKKPKLTKTQKDNIYNRLLEIERGINLIKKYKKINHSDKNYYGLKDMEHLYKDLGEYYRPILAK